MENQIINYMQRDEGTSAGCLGILVLDLHNLSLTSGYGVYYAHDIGRGNSVITTAIKRVVRIYWQTRAAFNIAYVLLSSRKVTI